MLIFLRPRKKGKVARNMPGSNKAARQERGKKSGARPAPPLLFTINEEDEQQKNGSSKKVKGRHCKSLRAIDYCRAGAGSLIPVPS